MSSRPPDLGKLPHQIRAQLEAAPERLRELRERFRDDPGALVHSPVTRVVVVAILGIAALLAAGWLVRGLAPGGTTAVNEDATSWSVLYVACTNPNCLATATIHRERSFNEWPVVCETCKEKSAYRAQTCPNCERSYAVEPGKPNTCPHCANLKKKATPTTAPEDKPQKHSDDAEDPW